MQLDDFLTMFLADKEAPVSNGTRENWYVAGVADFSDYLGEMPTLLDLTRERVNAWLDARVVAEKLRPATIRTRRNAILCLWRGAVELELLTDGPNRIRKIRVARKNPDAWSRSEVEQLFEYAANSSRNRMLPKTALPSRLFISSLIAGGYDSALRLGDLLSLERDWIRATDDGGGVIRTLQNKTDRLVQCRFNPGTMKLIDELMTCGPKRRMIWPLWCRRESFYAAFKRVVNESGIRPGTFRYLRRSSATHVELANPGRGYLHCGHADEAITRKHYLDADQLAVDAVSPGDLTRQPSNEPSTTWYEPIVVIA